MGFWDQVANAASGNGGGGGYGGGDQGRSYYSGGQWQSNQMPWQMQQGGQGSYNWRNFMDQYSQIQQANQGWQVPQNPWQQQQEQQREEENSQPKYRKMTDLERFSAQARQASDFINNAVGNALFGEPNENSSAISPENVPRMIANIPGMFIGSIPDLAAYGSELIAGTPAQEGNLETGMIEDRKLTPEEAGADVLYGGLSVASLIPGVGTEAKLAGAALKGAGKVTGKELLSTAGKIASTGENKAMGAIEQAARDAGKTGAEITKAKWKDAGVSALASAGTEALQEGLQTAAEDIRYHQFDLSDPNETGKRMAEGAFWGGLAGGLVGGAPSAVHAAMKNKAESGTSDPTSGSPAIDSSPFRKMQQSDWESLQARNKSGMYTPGMRKYYDDLAKSDNRLRSDGAVNLILKTSDDTLGLHEWGVGVDDFVDAWNQGDNAKSGIARMVAGRDGDANAAAADIESAINSNTVDNVSYQSTAEAMNAVNQKYNNGRGFEAAIEKRPGAKYTGGYGFISKFNDGRGFTCHPALVKQINADFDSDMGVMHFVTRNEKGSRLLNLDGYFGEKILSPEGVSLVDFYYTDYNKDRYNSRTFSKKLKFIFEPYSKQILDSGGKEVDIAGHFVNKMSDAVRSGSDQQIAQVIEEIRQTANALKQAAINEKENGLQDGQKSVLSAKYVSENPDYDPSKFVGGLGAVSNLFRSSRAMDRNRLRQLKREKQAGMASDLAKMAIQTMRNAPDFSDDVKKALDDIDIGSPLYKHGSIHGSDHAIDVYEQIGMALYTLEKKVNQPFRQHGQLGLNHAKVMGAYTEAFESLTAAGLQYDVVDAIIRCSFRVARTGTTPLDAIEGLIDSRIIQETENGFGLDVRRIESEQDFDSMEEVFSRAWDEGAEDYRIVHQIPTANGEIADPTAPVRNSISDKSTEEKDSKFLQMFSGHTLGSLFKDAPRMYEDYPLGDVVSYFAENPGEYRRIFSNAPNASVNNVLDRLIKVYASEKKSLHNSIVSLFKNMKLDPILKRMEKNGGKIDHNDYSAVTWYVQNLVDLITPEGFHYLGITDPIDFIENTEFGNNLINPDYRVRLNTFVSLLARAKFGIYQDALLGRLSGLTEEEAEQAKLNARASLEQDYRGRPGIQGLIANELLDGNGQSNTLEVLLSLDGTFETKESWFKQYTVEQPGTDMLVDLLIDTDDDFSISTVSKKYRAADLSISNYQRALFSESRKVVDSIKKAIDKNTLNPQLFAAAMDNAAKACKIEFSDDPMVVSIFNSLGTAGAKMEKGVNPKAESSVAEQANIARLGSAYAYFDSITAYIDGGVDIDNFAMNPRLVLAVLGGLDLSNITGNKDVRVFGNGKTAFVDRDWVFSQVSKTYDPAKEPTAYDWLSFLDRFPQYESYFSGLIAQPVISGGEGSATLAKTDNLMNAVKEYQGTVTSPNEGETDTVVARQAEHAEMLARNVVMSDGRFGPLAIFCMKDLSQAENTTMPSIRHDYRAVSKKLTRSILYDALSGSSVSGGSRLGKLRKQVRASVTRANFDHVQDLYDDAVQDLENYSRDMFNFDDQVNEIMAAANQDDFTVDVAQDLLDDVLDSRGVKDHPTIQSIDTTTGELSQGELDLKELDLQAKYTINQIQEIIRNTESISESDDADIGEITDHMLGLGTKSDPTINRQTVKNIVEQALEQMGQANILTAEEWAKVDAAIDRAYDRRYKSASIDSYQVSIDDLNNNGRDGSVSKIMTPIPRLSYSDIPPRRSVGSNASYAIYKNMDEIIGYLKTVNAFSDYQENPVTFVASNFYTEDGNLKTQEWMDFIREVNNRVIEHALREVNSALNTGVNENAYCAAYEWFQAYDDLVRKVREELENSLNPWGQGNDRMYIPELANEFENDHDIPQPNFFNKYNQGCATEFTVSISGGQVPGSISRNGGYLKKANATSNLPHNRAGSIDPVPYTIEKINSERVKHPDIDQWICIKNGTWRAGQEAFDNKEYEITTIGAMLKSGQDLSKGILVFDPKDNPHGMWVTNTPASLTDTNKPALRLSSIIGAIIDASQEPLVLKLKKRFEEKIDLVTDKGFGSRGLGKIKKKFSYDTIDDTSVSDFGSTLRNAIDEYRYGIDGNGGFAGELSNLFEGELNDTGFGYTQAMILAQGLTPGVVMNINGTNRCISCETIFNAELLSKYMNDIMERDGSFVASSGRMFTVTPSELHSRIISSIDEAEMNAENSNTDINRSDIKNAAYEACTTGWNSFLDKSNQLTVDEIFSHGSALGWRHPSNITPEEVATTFAKYMDIDTEGRYGSVPKPIVPKKGRPINSETSKEIKTAVNLVTNTYDIDGFDDLQPKVIRVFISDSDKLRNQAEGYDDLTALDIIPDDAYWIEPGRSFGVGIVQDSAQLKKALEWSERTGNHLLIPTAYRSQLKSNRDIGGFIIEYGITVDGEEYIHYNASAINSRQQVKNSIEGESSATPFNINSIQGTLLNQLHVYNPGDATLQTDRELSQRLTDAKASKQSILQLTNGISGKISMINGDSAEKLLAELYDENGNPKNNDDWRNARVNLTADRFKEVPIDQLQSDIYSFLTLAKDNKIDDDGFDRANAGRNKILGIINVEAVNGDRAIVPIMAPNNSPIKYDSCSVTIGNDGNVYIVYSTSLQTFGNKPNEQYFKASLPDMSFKGVVALMPESMEAPTYQLMGATKGSSTAPKKIRLITSWDTVKSRIPGRERQILISDMWYFSKLEGMSALYDRDGGVKKYILDQYKDPTGAVDVDGLTDLLAGRKEQWDRVARDDIRLSPDPEARKIHREIIRNYSGKIHLPYLFSPGWDAEGKRTKINVRFYLALDKTLYDQDRVLRFFHSLDDNLCPNGFDDDTNINNFMFNHEGKFHVISQDTDYWDFVKWGAPDGIGAFSELTGQSSKAGESHQAFVRLAMDKGYNGRDSQMALDYAELQAGNPSLYRDKMIRDFANRKSDRIYAKKSSRGYNHPVSDLHYASREEREIERKIRRCGDSLLPENQRTVHKNNKEIDDPYAVVVDGVRHNNALDAFNELQSLFSSPLSKEVVNGLTVYETGYTYDDGKGTNRISLDNLASSIRSIVRNINEYGLPIISEDLYINRGSRIPQPLINKAYARALWDSCEEIRNHEENQKDGEPDFDTFVDRMKQEQKKTDSFLHSISGKKYIGKKNECLIFSEYNWRQWGESGKAGLIYESWTAEDVMNTANWFLEPLKEELEAHGLDIDVMRDLNEQSAQLIADTRAAADGRRFTRYAPSPNSRTGKIGSQPLDHSRGYHKVFKTLTEQTQLMGALDIFLTPANVLYRLVNQSIMGSFMSLGRKFGMVDKKSLPNQDYIKRASHDDADAQALWAILRESAFQGDQTELFAFLQEGGTISDYLDMKADADTSLQKKYQKARDLVYKIVSGGNIGMSKQLENFYNRLVYFFNEDPALKSYWLDRNPRTGTNRMEDYLAQDGGGAKLLQEIFINNESNISLLAGMQALESSRGADIAQSHIVIEIFKNLTNKNPIPQFFVTSTISRFPRYALNFMEECINLILPMCTLRQAFISFAAEVGHTRAANARDNGGNYIDPHYEKLLRQTNIREAMIVDALHFGAFGMLCILAGLPGAIQPPEDEKKWGNYKEWLILQHRVGEAWWIEDILGIVAPAACFWKSVQLGKPRFDLITNGVSDVCYSNPMIKISDAVEFMMDPTGEINRDYQSMVEKYSNAPDSRTGFMDYIQAKGTTFGLSYISQFFTPTFVKSLTNWGTQYELDYKNIYKSNVRGVVTEGGEAGEDLVRTSYEDAMIRRLTRKNPVLALLMDVTRPSTTSYSGSDFIAGMTGKMTMPFTRYIDQHQYDGMKQWSISGMSEQDAKAKTAQIIVTLMQYQDDLDALMATGFYLDSETKRAVSSMIWDTYYQLDTEWNEFNQSEQSDYKVLGNGDWEAGKQTYYEIKEMYQQNKREINSFYYKVMKSSQLSQPIIEYRRYNTSYAQDDDGNFYATGFHPQSVLPFTSAPGTLTDPEGTAGYQNDFVTVSAATGKPLENMRALVPMNAGEYTEWPDLESWSDDGNGNGYSKVYQNWYNTDANGLSIKTTGTVATPTGKSAKTPSGASGSRSGGGGGRRGGGGGYGGGGRSYTPNIYAPNVNLPRSSMSKIMNTDRVINPDEQYLRPDFETKGSREAYRRSDI